MAKGLQVEPIGEGLYRLVDVLGNHAYLVVGSERALMVDACGGFANVAEAAREICELPVDVAVTHTHYDHFGGAAFFGRVYVPAAELGRWEAERALCLRVLDQLVEEGLVDEADACGPRDCAAPEELPLEAGHVFDLGGRTVRVVALPGHTDGSVGYLVEDARVLLSGDAVTPIMCLFFAESQGVDVWRDTLLRMQELPFDHFYTGHHDHAFCRDDLPSFVAAADFVAGDRGMEWEHNRLHEFRGILHLAPSETFDADSPDFRAVIEPWHELPPRKRRRRRKVAEEAAGTEAAGSDGAA